MGNCCSERKKIGGKTNFTEEQVLDKVRSVQMQLVQRFPELTLRTFDKFDSIKAVDNINSALIIIGTVIEDDFLDNTNSLTQDQLNKIYHFIIEIEELTLTESKNFSLYREIFEDNKEFYEKLHKEFESKSRSFKINSPVSTEVDEPTSEKKQATYVKQTSSMNKKKSSS
jgi:hypothetical protein